MNGMREVAYFIAWAFSPEVRADKEKELLARYLDALACHGVGDETPSLSEAFDLYRLMMIDAWTSAWAPLAIGGMDQPGQAEILLDRMYGMLLDLDVEKALRDAI